MHALSCLPLVCCSGTHLTCEGPRFRIKMQQSILKFVAQKTTPRAGDGTSVTTECEGLPTMENQKGRARPRSVSPLKTKSNVSSDGNTGDEPGLIETGTEKTQHDENKQTKKRRLSESGCRTARVETVNRWKKSGFNWLEFQEENGIVKMIWCQYCKQYPDVAKRALHRGKQQMTDSNAYVTGTRNIKLVCVKDHAKSSGHIAAEGAHKVASVSVNVTPIGQCLRKMQQDDEQKMIYLFDIAYNIAKQELPFTQFSTWVNTEKKHGVLLGDTYINDIQCKNFINEIAFHMERDLREAIKQSPYIGIMFDGSTDASCTERENICIKYTENGYPVTKFLG